MRVRAAVPSDIPTVLKLRPHAFRHTAQPSPAAAEAYMRTVLFENPWRQGALPSLVAEDEEGHLVGFLGVLTRPMTLEGRAIRMVVTTQLMADPKAGPMAGLTLMRHAMAGEQDLTIGDAANDDARRLWEALGGFTAQILSTFWTLPVRPSRLATLGWGDSPPARLARLLARPAVALRDREPALGDLSLAPLDGATAAAHLPQVAPRKALAPVYDAASFDWLLDRVREHGGTPLARAVRAGDAVIGWYVGTVKETRARLLQLAAVPRRHADVLHAARVDAWRAGAVTLVHRYDPMAVDSWAQSGARLERRGPWTLVRTRDPRAERALLLGDAFFTQLEGEAWFNF
jgi:hypothetical protein